MAGEEMQVLSSGQLLDLWERGHRQSTVRRALALLSAACSGQPVEELSRLSVGHRDDRLLALREAIFGPDVSATANCPTCGLTQELTFNIVDLRATGRSALTTDDQCEAPNSENQYTLSQGDVEVRFRVPNSLDLETLADHGSVQGDRDALKNMLLQRCLLGVRRQGQLSFDHPEPDAISQFPVHLIEAIERQMESIDPLADVELCLQCEACGSDWQLGFDIASFLWSEIDVWARRTLREIHELARAYGWSESEILTASPVRRSLYLQMIGCTAGVGESAS